MSGYSPMNTLGRADRMQKRKRKRKKQKATASALFEKFRQVIEPPAPRRTANNAWGNSSTTASSSSSGRGITNTSSSPLSRPQAQRVVHSSGGSRGQWLAGKAQLAAAAPHSPSKLARARPAADVQTYQRRRYVPPAPKPPPIHSSWLGGDDDGDSEPASSPVATSPPSGRMGRRRRRRSRLSRSPRETVVVLSSDDDDDEGDEAEEGGERAGVVDSAVAAAAVESAQLLSTLKDRSLGLAGVCIGVVECSAARGTAGEKAYMDANGALCFSVRNARERHSLSITGSDVVSCSLHARANGAEDSGGASSEGANGAAGGESSSSSSSNSDNGDEDGGSASASDSDDDDDDDEVVTMDEVVTSSPKKPPPREEWTHEMRMVVRRIDMGTLGVGQPGETGTVRVRMVEKHLAAWRRVAQYLDACVRSRPARDKPAKVAPSTTRRKTRSATASASKRQNNVQLFVYPSNTRDSVRVSSADMATLNDAEFLNDVIIDVFLNVIKYKYLNREERQRYYFFNTFFYTRFAEGKSRGERYANVRTWTKGVNVLERDYLIIPINSSAHWCLAIVCYPSLVSVDVSQLPANKRPCVLLFDSLRSPPGQYGKHILDYLDSVFLAEHPGHEAVSAAGRRRRRVFSPSTMPVYAVDVPQQPNHCDCGVFLLKYAWHFCLDDNPFDNLSTCPSKKGWFKTGDHDLRMWVTQELTLLCDEGATLDVTDDGGGAFGAMRAKIAARKRAAAERRRRVHLEAVERRMPHVIDDDDDGANEEEEEEEGDEEDEGMEESAARAKVSKMRAKVAKKGSERKRRPAAAAEVVHSDDEGELSGESPAALQWAKQRAVATRKQAHSSSGGGGSDSDSGSDDAVSYVTPAVYDVQHDDGCGDSGGEEDTHLPLASASPKRRRRGRSNKASKRASKKMRKEKEREKAAAAAAAKDDASQSTLDHFRATPRKGGESDGAESDGVQEVLCVDDDEDDDDDDDDGGERKSREAATRAAAVAEAAAEQQAIAAAAALTGRLPFVGQPITTFGGGDSGDSDSEDDAVATVDTRSARLQHAFGRVQASARAVTSEGERDVLLGYQ